MSLLTLNRVQLGYGHPLLDGVSFSLERGERVALIGRNGTGKSTFLKLLDRRIVPDDGEIAFQDGLRVARLEQEVPTDTQGTVFDVVSLGLGEIGDAVRRYHHITHALDSDPSGKALDELEACQQIIEAAGAWDTEKTIENLLTRLELPIDVDIATLSGLSLIHI